MFLGRCVGRYAVLYLIHGDACLRTVGICWNAWAPLLLEKEQRTGAAAARVEYFIVALVKYLCLRLI